MEDVTWQQALTEFESVYLPSRNLASRTRIEYLNDLKAFISFLEQSGILKVGKIATRQVDRYLAQLEQQGITGATRKRKAITIRSFLFFLYRSSYLQHDISRQVILPFAEARIPRVLAQAEYRGLLQACRDNIRDTAIITLLLQTGTRLSELTRLNVHDIDIPDIGTGQLRIVPSGSRKGRVVPLNSKASLAIQAYLQSRAVSANSPVFLTQRGKRLGGRGVEKMLAKYFKRVSIFGASPHSLRHTFGVQHIAKGTCIKTVQRVMGHQDIRTTEKYIPLVKEQTIKEIEQNALE